MNRCLKCARPVPADEIAITKKLVNRGATSFYCADCLAEHFQVTRADIDERIDYFRRMGCTLFAPAAGKEETA